eukprot:TRINITY_DN25044_c0_g1_i2.p1 TRINITY_DN25044_c0_g1~~TRINITY_DN25044_c0_g1_i2.p1  ORF type:complete len:611 (-),score=61.21 TRINITY_DN25044_c0_g1_i2:125-1957(-)
MAESCAAVALQIIRAFAASCILTCLAQKVPLTSPPGVGKDGAFEDCPCVDYAGDATWHPAATMLELADGRSVPRAYGSAHCSTWDNDTCAASSAHTPCSLLWCFVSPENCSKRRGITKSTALPALWLSYETCGNAPPPPRLSSAPRLSFGQGEKIYVYSFGRLVAQDSKGGPTNRFDVFLRLAHDTLREMGVSMDDVVYRDISNTSRSRFEGSSYSACVHDTLIGNLDLCIGDFWDTEERRLMGGRFATVVMSEALHLYAKKVEKELSLVQLIYKPLAVFTPGLWGVIVVALIASGALMGFLEWGEQDSEFQHKSFWGVIGMGLYMGLFSLTGASSTCQPVTVSGRCLNLGFGLFILIAVAGYTANTATFLIADMVELPFQSLEQTIDRKHAICVPDGFRTTFLNYYPKAEDLAVTITARNREDLFTAMDEKCDGFGILAETTVYEEWGNANHCDVLPIGDPIVEYPTGFFAAEWFEARFSASLLHRRFDGALLSMQRAIRTNNCQHGQAPGANRLDAFHMLGNIMLLVLCAMTSLIIRCFAVCKKQRLVQTAETRLSQAAHSVTHQLGDRNYDNAAARQDEINTDDGAKLDVIQTMLTELCKDLRQGKS